MPVERIGGPEAPVDWTSPAAIDAVLDRLRSRGPLAGIVHALPLGQYGLRASRIETDWSARVGDEVKGLFLLAKATAADLENAARERGSVPDRGDGPGGPIRQRGLHERRVLPRPRRDRRAGQDAGPRMARGPVPRGRFRRGRPDRDGRRPAGRRGVRRATAGPRWATTGAVGSACERSRARSSTRRRRSS